MQYITSTEFLASPYGADYVPGESIFASSGEIDEFLVSISSLIDLYCGRSFGPQTYTQVFDGFGGRVVFLNAIPVTGIVSVTYENFGSSGAVASTHYKLQKSIGKLTFSYDLDPDYTYTITYDAGYAVAPEPIRQATMMLANTYAQAIDNGAVAISDGGSMTEFRFSKFVERYTDTRQKNTTFEEGIPLTVLAILKRYKYMRT